MTQTAQIILDKVVLVKVEANIYGARKKLKKEDLVLADGSKLPPEDLASLGSKRLLDPDQLTVFNRLKKEAERICLRVGTRFLGGFIIPSDSASSITEELDRIGEDFIKAKADFLAGYDSAVNDWLVKHPEFAGIIEKAVDSVEFVSTRLSFDYLVLAVAMPETLPEKDIERLDSKIGSLSEQMFHEIAVEANHLIEQSLLGKDQVTRSALRPIKRIRDKLDGLGFLDYRVAPVVTTIDELLTRIPDRGAIEGSLLQEILATAMLLADPDKTRRHGEGLLAGQAVVDEVEEDETLEVDQNLPIVSTSTLTVPIPDQDVPMSETTVEVASLSLVSDQSVIAGESVANLNGVNLVEDNEMSADDNLFSGLFDGIFEEDDAFDAELEVISSSESDSKSTSEFEADLVTTEEDSEENSDSDYWF
jgi:hypothetical protein